MKLKEIAENHGLTPDGVDYALTQYQIVLYEITHGMLSKLSYNAKDIIRIAQDRWCETCDLKEQEETGGWISVKDRLPETNDEVLTTYVYDDEPNERYVESASYYDNGKGEGHWISVWDEYRIGHVRKTTIAWMPMPKPYEPPKEENRDATD